MNIISRGREREVLALSQGERVPRDRAFTSGRGAGEG
jgi:hypothetical protein